MVDDIEPPLGDGRYRLLAVLGVGGMSKVYRAYDALTEEFIAIKVLSQELASRKSIRERFLSELRTMARLRHPHIVHVSDMGTDGDRVYLLMELMTGGSLMERVDAYGPLGAQQACRVMDQVLDALDFSHAHGVVHRDVKPQNILLTRTGNVKVTDFGIAAVATRQHDLTRTGAIMGTWAYMAPEQRRNAKHVDARSDVYSAGATLCTLLTGQEPLDLYVDDTHEEMFKGMNEGLAELIQRATRYRVDERVSTAQLFRETLRELAQALPDDGGGAAPLVSPEKHRSYPRPLVTDYVGLLRERAEVTPEPTEEMEISSSETFLPGGLRDIGGLQREPEPSPPERTARVREDLRGLLYRIDRCAGGVRVKRRWWGGATLGVGPRIEHVRVEDGEIRCRTNVAVTERDRTRAAAGSTPLRTESAQHMMRGVVQRRNVRADEFLWVFGYGLAALCIGSVTIALGIQWAHVWPVDTEHGEWLARAVSFIGMSGQWGGGAAVGVLAPWALFRWSAQRRSLLFFEFGSPATRRQWVALNDALERLSAQRMSWKHALASTQHRAKPVRIRRRLPSAVGSNLRPWQLRLGPHRVTCFPDGAWVEQPGTSLKRHAWSGLSVMGMGPQLDLVNLEDDIGFGAARERVDELDAMGLSLPGLDVSLSCEDGEGLNRFKAALYALGAGVRGSSD